jgi:heme A synthase
LSPFRLSLLLAAATFCLLLIGGTVKPTGSSLACPDWPLCHGQVFPEMKGGVLFEHSHRLAATAVGLLTIGFLVVAVRNVEVPLRVKRLAVALLVMVVVQGVLGGITVLLRLPTIVSTAHLALSMAFFASVLTCAWWLRDAQATEMASGAPRGLALATLLAVYLQIVFGGFVRHTGAGRACGLDFPTCGGEWWPHLWESRAHQLHRGIGVLVAGLIITAAIPCAARAARLQRPWVRRAALATPLLAVLQVVLGIATVTSGIRVPEVLGHFTVGILLLAGWHATWLGLGPRGRPVMVEDLHPRAVPASGAA